MKNFYILSLVIIGAIFGSCSDENETPNPAAGNNLVIKTEIPETRALKTQFVANDEMGIYVKSSTISSGWYDGVTGVTKATYNGNAWTLAPDVVLNKEVAHIFAYYPYSAAVTNPEAIAMNTAAQTDYLYGGSANTASSANNTLVMRMSHAQANFRFNVTNIGYLGAGVLKSIGIQNKTGKSVFYTEGTFNAATGDIAVTGANAAYTIADINKTIETNGWTSNLPSAMVIPFNIQTKGDIEFIFQIDNETYTIKCPVEEDGYARGQQYTFNLKLSGRDLILNKEDITIEPWGDNSVDLDDVVTRGNSIIYSVTTTANNQIITIPDLNLTTAGDVSVSFGDGQSAAYTSGLKHTYQTQGNYQIVIASEASIGEVAFSDIMSVSDIDLSGI